MRRLNQEQSLNIFTDPLRNWKEQNFIQLTVNPELADYLLKNNHRANRTIKAKVVAKYARDMKQGNWKFTGESIGIDDEGWLCNGQHRLLAVRKANTTIQIPFVFGLEKDAMRAMDSGASRSYADQLSISRGDKFKTTDLATAIRLLAMWEMDKNNLGKVIHNSPAFSTQELDNILNANPGLEKYVKHPILASSFIGRNRGMFGCMFYLLSQNHPEEAETFFSGLATGANLHEKSPILALRNRLDKRNLDKGETLRAAVKLCLLSKAWNAFIEGKDVSKLVISKPRKGEFLKIKFNTVDDLILEAF
jgi:hypothetical protein